MAQADDFLAAIIADPDSDLPRLAYADWLEEHGDPASVARSEFIRVQCELAKLPEDHPQVPTLFDREQGLLLEYGEQWRREVEFTEVSTPGPFVRGFLEALRVHGVRRVVAIQNELAAALPLRSLTVTGYGEIQISRQDWQQFFTSPVVFRAEELVLSSIPLTEFAVEAFCGQHFANWRGLELSNNSLQTRQWELMLDNPSISRLESLSLVGNQIRDIGVEALAERPLLANLKRLCLRAGDFGVNAASALSQSDQLPAGNLREFEFCAKLGDAGVDVLLGAPWIERLKVLNLESCAITDRGAFSLANSPKLRQLRALHLEFNLFGSSGLKALKESSHLREDLVLSVEDPIDSELWARGILTEWAHRHVDEPSHNTNDPTE